jgi:hypothetical protein
MISDEQKQRLGFYEREQTIDEIMKTRRKKIGSAVQRPLPGEQKQPGSVAGFEREPTMDEIIKKRRKKKIQPDIDDSDSDDDIPRTVLRAPKTLPPIRNQPRVTDFNESRQKTLPVITVIPPSPIDQSFPRQKSAVQPRQQLDIAAANGQEFQRQKTMVGGMGQQPPIMPPPNSAQPALDEKPSNANCCVHCMRSDMCRICAWICCFECKHSLYVV